MGVVGDHDDQRVVALGGEILGELDRVVEHDGVVDRALPVERVAVFVDAAGLHHQHEALLVLRQDVERDPHLVGEVGLVGEFGHGALLEEEAVERAVDVAGVEQAEHLVGASRRVELGLGRHELVACVLELLDVVVLVGALAAGRRLGQEIRRAAAHDHLGLHVVEHLHDVVVVGAAARVRHHGGRRRVLDLGVGDDADRHAAARA